MNRSQVSRRLEATLTVRHSWAASARPARTVVRAASLSVTGRDAARTANAHAHGAAGAAQHDEPDSARGRLDLADASSRDERLRPLRRRREHIQAALDSLGRRVDLRSHSVTVGRSSTVHASRCERSSRGQTPPPSVEVRAQFFTQRLVGVRSHLPARLVLVLKRDRVSAGHAVELDEELAR